MNNINLCQNNNMNFKMNKNLINNQPNLNQIKVCVRKRGMCEKEEPTVILAFHEEKVSDLIDKWRKITKNNDETLEFTFNAKNLNPSLTLAEAGIREGANIFAVSIKPIKGAGGVVIHKEINIKFIKLSKNIIYNNENPELIGLLKLCLLKEVSQKISYNDLKKLPELIYCIMKILSIGFRENEWK